MSKAESMKVLGTNNEAKEMRTHYVKKFRGAKWKAKDWKRFQHRRSHWVNQPYPEDGRRGCENGVGKGVRLEWESSDGVQRRK